MEVSTPNKATEVKSKVEEVPEVPEVPFSWAEAQRIELKPQVIMQADIVFLNLPLKGYNKDEDIRYALSADELVLEIRDRSQKGVHRIRRLC